MVDRLDNFKLKPFISSPTEFLVAKIAEKVALVPQFKLIFGPSIFPYLKRDIGDRQTPTLRIYNERYTKEAESWFINGDIMADCIFPPSIRHEELQQLQDTLSSALLQQFRRQTFFDDMVTEVPGLNELGKVFSIDKSLGMEWNDELMIPLTQITINFRLDLRAWDNFMESDDRTKDDPFERTLANLESIYATIAGRNDADVTEVTVGPDHKFAG